jgi:HSP20 family protein
MKLIRYNTPFANFGRLADFNDWFSGSSLSRFFEGSNGSVVGSLATDIHEDKDSYLVRFEMPGVKKEDVKIELNDRLLTVSAEKKEKTGEAESSSSYSRSISVPDSVKADSISAKLEDGILTVTLPKSEERKPRNIELS